MTILMGNKILKRQNNSIVQINNSKPKPQALVLPIRLNIAPSYIIYGR